MRPDLDDFDLRQPLTPTGTNLLGLVKHLVGLEYGYLGFCFGRPGERLSWVEDGSVAEGADMWYGCCSTPGAGRSAVAAGYALAIGPGATSSRWSG
ncbi:mycothiol transferase [Desertihabitans brevis]|uniref:mycothiol transferase n=1 Tax=Desertihabitans brevis TaxID=2268447 RepID=UPI001F1D5CF5|nr:DUF664 domain-containing protein [Desertihabitans brevis]